MGGWATACRAHWDRQSGEKKDRSSEMRSDSEELRHKTGQGSGVRLGPVRGGGELRSRTSVTSREILAARDLNQKYHPRSSTPGFDLSSCLEISYRFLFWVYFISPAPREF